MICKRQQKNPFPQTIRCLEEKHLANGGNLESKDFSKHWQQHFDGPLLDGLGNCKQFKHCKSSEMYLSVSTNDNCSYLGGSACTVKNMVLNSSGSTFVIVSKFPIKEEFLSYPFNLSLWDIYLVSGYSQDLLVYSVNEIEFKYVLLPHPRTLGCFVAIPFNHSKN